MTQPIHPMLERVMSALYEADASGGISAPADYERMARAAIQTLLEPDEGMVEAGVFIQQRKWFCGADENARTLYQAMLRPLIGEGE